MLSLIRDHCNSSQFENRLTCVSEEISLPMNCELLLYLSPFVVYTTLFQILKCKVCGRKMIFLSRDSFILTKGEFTKKSNIFPALDFLFMLDIAVFILVRRLS